MSNVKCEVIDTAYYGIVYIDRTDGCCDTHERRCYEDVVSELRIMASDAYPGAGVEVCSQSRMTRGIEIPPDMYARAWGRIDSTCDHVGKWSIYTRPDYTQTYTSECKTTNEVGYHADGDSVPGYWYTSGGGRDSERTPITRAEARADVDPDVWATLPDDLADPADDDEAEAEAEAPATAG